MKALLTSIVLLLHCSSPSAQNANESKELVRQFAGELHQIRSRVAPMLNDLKLLESPTTNGSDRKMLMGRIKERLSIALELESIKSRIDDSRVHGRDLPDLIASVDSLRAAFSRARRSLEYSPQWAFDAREAIRRSGFDFRLCGQFGESRADTFFESAITGHASAMALLGLHDVSPRTTEDQERFAALVQLTPVICQLLLYFTPELHMMGVDNVQELVAKISKIGATYGRYPFVDVPKDHWAANAIGTLHELGLIKGYPGGRFLTP